MGLGNRNGIPNLLTLMKIVYAKYTREDSLCQSNGFFSLNLTPKSISRIEALLDLNEPVAFEKRIGWVGFGDGRELLCLATAYPSIRFVGFEINQSAVAIAKRVLGQLQLPNVDLRHEDAMHSTETFTHVYSTAISGPELYARLRNMSSYKLCMLDIMWEKKIPADSLKAVVYLSGSRERRQLVASHVASGVASM